MTDSPPIFNVEQTTDPGATLYEDPGTVAVPEFQPAELQNIRHEMYTRLQEIYEMHEGAFILPPPTTEQTGPSPPPEYVAPGEELPFDEFATMLTIEKAPQ